MLAKINSAQVIGLNVFDVEIETDISKGVRSFSIIGLPDKAIEEAKDRIVSAVKNSEIEVPKVGARKVVVSLAPADLKKEGPIFDLPIAVAYLLALGAISLDTKDKMFVGELGLSGVIRPIRGALKIVKHAKERGIKEIFLPIDNAKEASLISGIDIYGCENLKQVVSFIGKDSTDKFKEIKLEKHLPTQLAETSNLEDVVDFKDIAGQESVKRALEIAVAGGHNIAMYGPPGTGKTLLAKSIPGIMPPLSLDEVLEVTGIHSVVGSGKIITHPPFRSPHHTSSYVSIVGGGANPRPGEITLAHRGVLFLDEFPEFDKRVIESLRQPLEDRVVNISRAKMTSNFPADFMLVAALNPCPCGNLGLENKECTCSQMSIQKYQRKISGPIVDRIDIWINVPQIDYEKLLNGKGRENSNEVRNRIILARSRQQERLKDRKINLNGQMGVRDIKDNIFISDEISRTLNKAATKLELSPRSYHKILKLSRTIADLDGSEKIMENHLLEALQYRPKMSF